MPDKVKAAAKPDLGSQEVMEEIIRVRAYLLFEQRGYQHGRDVDDWLEAEAQVLGKKRSASPAEREHTRHAKATA